MAGRDRAPRRRAQGQAPAVLVEPSGTHGRCTYDSMDLFRRWCLALSGLNGDIQTLWPSAATEAVAPCGHGRPDTPGAGHTSCPRPCDAPQAAMLYWKARHS